MFLVQEIHPAQDYDDIGYETPLCLFKTKKEADMFSLRCGTQTEIIQVLDKEPETMFFTFVFDLYKAYVLSQRETYPKNQDFTLEISLPSIESCTLALEKPKFCETRNVGIASYITVEASHYTNALKEAQERAKTELAFTYIGSDGNVHTVTISVK